MSREAKTALLSEFAHVGKALASPLRLELLDLLGQGERSVEHLADLAGARVGNTSAQLQRLREAGLVTARRDGNRIHYRLAGEDVAALLLALRATGSAHRAEVERAAAGYLGADVEQVGRDELLARARSGEVVVLDVRPAAEYHAGHIPGALSVPLGELPRRLNEIPAQAEVVAYCRGAYCVFAHDAVRLLASHNRRARRLRDGFLEWKAAGLPVATAP